MVVPGFSPEIRHIIAETECPGRQPEEKQMHRHFLSWRNPMLWVSVIALIAVVLIIVGFVTTA